MSSESIGVKILVTGAAGMIGNPLVQRLRQKYGLENVIASDVRHESQPSIAEPFEVCDITDIERLEAIVTAHKINWIFNQSAILTLTCENNPQLAMKVNMGGLQNILEVARRHNVRVFSASSIGTFGPSTPKNLTPDETVQHPTNFYGCTKVGNELMGEFYHRKWGVDFRCLRYSAPVVDESTPTGRGVDYIGLIFAAAVRTGKFTVDVSEHTTMPYVHIDDLIDGTIKVMEAPNERLTRRVYNMMAFSASLDEIVAEIKKTIPKFEAAYEPNQQKQAILDSLPDSFDCSNAVNDWGWAPKFGLEATVKNVIASLKRKAG